MVEEPKYYVLNEEGRSDHFPTEDDAVRQASRDDRQGRIPISVACFEHGSGRIIYTARALKQAIQRWRDAHPDE